MFRSKGRPESSLSRGKEALNQVSINAAMSRLMDLQSSTKEPPASLLEAVRADFVVELRGFEPLTSAEQVPVRGDGATASKG